MTRQAFLKKYLFRFAVSLTLLGLIVYTLYHVFASSSGSLMTTPIQRTTDYRVISGKAYLFREESVLTSPREGLVNDLAQSGAKISRGVALTEVWECPTQTREELQARLDDLNRLIGILEASRLPTGTPLSQAGSYRDTATSDYEALRTAIENGDWTSVQGLETSLLTLLNQYACLTDPNSGIDQTLTNLKDARAKLLTGTPLTLKNDKASGYYYDRGFVDGYESLFTLDALNTLDAARFAELTSAEPQSPMGGFSVGKMVYGYEWSLAIAFDAASSAFLTANETYSFRFPENRDRELTLVCTKLIPTDENGAIAVFTSNEVLTDFTYLRMQTAEITVDACSGYYIPESAIHTVDGVEGVYIFLDSTVHFRRIEVLYRGDGYCIAAEAGGREDYPALYDILVTSGKNLYDGRVYQ